MLILSLSFLKTNRQLADYYRDRIVTRDIRERRKSVSICVIDDQPFAPQTNLSNYGYRIEAIGDIKTIEEISAYDLILCDIIGVGRHFDERLQGASVIAEIKRCHPDKVIVAYTGAALNQLAAKSANYLADDLIKKDADIEDWIQRLDSYTEMLLDPHATWQRIRQDLVRREVDTKDILIIEDGYVRSILAKGSSSVMNRALSKTGVRQDVRSIITGVISSAAYAYITAH
jgi:CheY-like chemotaxis protein